MSIDTAVASLRDARAELLRELELVEEALAVLAPTPSSGLVVAAPSASAAPEVVSLPVPPRRATDSQPNGKHPRRPFTAQQRAEAVALADSIGRSPAAKKLGIDAPLLDKWRRAAREQTPLPDAPKVSFADRIRAETADIEQRRKALDESRLIRIAEANATAAAAAQARDDRPKAAMVPSGLPRQPIDHDAVRRNQFPRDA